MNCDRYEDGMQEYRSFVSDWGSSVRWPILYALCGMGDSLSKGTIFAITASECRVTGMMPVEVGMRLRLWGGPREKPTPFHLPEATVVWSEGHEFGLDLHSLQAVDQRWLTGFLAERIAMMLAV